MVNSPHGMPLHFWQSGPKWSNAGLVQKLLRLRWKPSGSETDESLSARKEGYKSAGDDAVKECSTEKKEKSQTACPKDRKTKGEEREAGT